jgi:hypothetical protein
VDAIFIFALHEAVTTRHIRDKAKQTRDSCTGSSSARCEEPSVAVGESTNHRGVAYACSQQPRETRETITRIGNGIPSNHAMARAGWKDHGRALQYRGAVTRAELITENLRRDPRWALREVAG